MSTTTALATLTELQSSLVEATREYSTLLNNLNQVEQQREQNNYQMTIPVQLGMGVSCQGVVPDSSRVSILDIEDNTWSELDSREAIRFVQGKLVVLQEKYADLDEPIARLREERDLASKTLKAYVELQQQLADGSVE